MEDNVKKEKAKSKDYPALTLMAAVEFLQAFKDYPLNKQISYAVAAKVKGVSETTKSFRYAISAARQYGLISTGGSAFSFLDAGKKLIRPTDDAATISSLKMQCFSNPKLYGELISQYKGRSIPNITTLENLLVTYNGIMASAANTAAQTFIDTATEVGANKSGVLDLDVDAIEAVVSGTVMEAQPERVDEVSKVAVSVTPQKMLLEEGFEAPLTIPFGEQKKAILYMPQNVEKDDAEYALEMIKLMFKKIYGVGKND
ncbi:MAG: hypothetical protein FWD89_00365 [Firmicutes bacterium]|nr:hypothetical protein [Bacillota bacterium]